MKITRRSPAPDAAANARIKYCRVLQSRRLWYSTVARVFLSFRPRFSVFRTVPSGFARRRIISAGTLESPFSVRTRKSVSCFYFWRFFFFFFHSSPVRFSYASLQPIPAVVVVAYECVSLDGIRPTFTRITRERAHARTLRMIITIRPSRRASGVSSSISDTNTNNNYTLYYILLCWPGRVIETFAACTTRDNRQ